MANDIDLQSITDSYVNLLIVQYIDQPRARATIASFVNRLLADGILWQIRDAFELSTAIGYQLDILGKYIGVNRFFNLPGELINNNIQYFSFTYYGDLNPDSELGFNDYSTYNSDTGQTLLYSGIVGGSSALNDAQYLQILYLKIAINQCNSSKGNIDTLLYQFFGTSIYCETNNMMDITYFSTLLLGIITMVAFQKGMLPKPMGVKLYNVVSSDEDLFAFTDYADISTSDLNTVVTGFTTYQGYNTDIGAMLTYSDILV